MCQAESVASEASNNPAIDSTKLSDDMVSFVDQSMECSTTSVIEDSAEKKDMQKISSRRRVSFDHDNQQHVVHDTEPMSQEEIQGCFMQAEDFERCNEAVKDAIKQWATNKTEKATTTNSFLHQEHYSIRGLEELLDHMKHSRRASSSCGDKKSRASLKLQHIELVLCEVRRQKQQQSTLDMEQIRRVSERSSAASLERAIKFAAKDEQEVRSAVQQPKLGVNDDSHGLSEQTLKQSSDNPSVVCQEAVPTQESQQQGNKKARRSFLGFMKRK